MENLLNYKYETLVVIRAPEVNLYRDEMSIYITKILKKQDVIKVNNLISATKLI